jgi:hypothetical protein
MIRRPILIDTDKASDDTVALIMALHSLDVDVKAITVVAGNLRRGEGEGDGAVAADDELGERCRKGESRRNKHPFERIRLTCPCILRLQWHTHFIGNLTVSLRADAGSPE